MQENPHQSATGQDQEFQFVFDRLSRQKKLIIGLTLAGVILAGLYTLFVPPKYEARTSIVMPAQSDISGGALGLAKSIGILPSGAGGGSNLSMFTAILNSERMLNRLEEKTGIKKEDLRKIGSVTQDDQANLILIRYFHKDPDMAKKLCTLSLDALREFNAELSLPTKSERTKLLNDKISHYTDELRTLELKFQTFADESQSVPLGLESEEGAGGNLFTQKQKLAELRSQLKEIDRSLAAASSAVEQVKEDGSALPTDIPQLQKQYEELRKAERELAAARVTYTKESPIVIDLKSKVEALRNQIRVEALKYSKSFKAGLVQDINELKVSRSVIQDQINELEIKVDVAPKEAVEYARIKREVSFVEEVLKQLLVASETAEMEAASDPNRWEVLDRPQLADKPVNKRFGLSMGIGLLAGLFLSVTIALVRKPS